MNGMTVAIDARLLTRNAGGDSTYWRGLVSGLQRLDVDARFLLFFNAREAPSIPNDPRFESVALPADSERWWSLVAFPMAARKRSATVIHTQYNLSPLVGRQGVTTVHDVSFLIGPQWFRPRDRLLLRRFVPSSVRRARRVLTVSETSRHEIERLIPASRGKTRVTPLALNPAVVPMPREQAKVAVAAALGLKRSYLLSVSTRWPRKNMGLAVQAFERLDRDLDLVLVGSHHAGASYTSSRVIETGYVSDELLGPLYSAAELYLCPSRHEGFGLPLLEAFACECPVVCSQGGALPEVAGGAAEVVESWDPVAWADAIGRLLDDSSKVRDMRRRGLERVGQYDWIETARRTFEVYREVSG